MDEKSLRLDGNALAGALQDIFVQEVTVAPVECAHCGKVEAIGAEHVYMRAPGAVVRCRHCENVLMVLVNVPGGYRIAFEGCAWIDVRDQA